MNQYWFTMTLGSGKIYENSFSEKFVFSAVIEQNFQKQKMNIDFNDST